VFAGVYPISSDEFDGLSAAIEKLTLTDASVSVKRESSDALGPGFRYSQLDLTSQRGGVSNMLGSRGSRTSKGKAGPEPLLFSHSWGLGHTFVRHSNAHGTLAAMQAST